MEKVRRQHYVPRMYLKRFGYGNIDDEYISVLKLDNGTVLDNRKVENFAVANYFYDADKEQIAEILKEDLKVFPELCDNEKLSDEQFPEHALAREESASKAKSALLYRQLHLPVSCDLRCHSRF